MKGQIAIIEAILSAIVLFIAFNMMITAGEYQTKWKESLNSLEGRDALITADRLGKLHDYVFYPLFRTEFLNRIDSIKDFIVKNETQGTLKGRVYVACDCTSGQVAYLQSILNDVKFNTRPINGVVCSTTLPDINNCGANTRYPNALVIWGYRDLSPHINPLLDFISEGNSVIEIADIQNSRVDGQGGDDDEGQKRIFGLTAIGEEFPLEQEDEFLKPINTSQLPYQSYKWFYHLPYLLTGTSISSIPRDTGGNICTSPSVATTGNFKFQDVDRRFWICDGISVYFDTNGNNMVDLGPISRGQEFSIGNSNFKINYIDANDKMRISFKPDYEFNDFIPKRNPAGNILPQYNKLAISAPNYKTRVLLSMGFWDRAEERPVAGITFNGTENGKAVWMADFSRDGLEDTADDHKQLLASLVLSIANKKTKETFQQVGQIASYINVNNTDILEIYKIDLSIGAPF